MTAQEDIMHEAKQNGWKAMMTIALVYVIKQFLNSEDENHVQIVRGLYVTAFVSQLLLTLFIKFVKVSKLEGDEAMVTVMKKENPFDTEERKVRQCIFDYDTEQVNQKLQQIMIGAAMTAFLHLKMKLVLPLAIQAFLGPYSTYDSPLFKIHVLGKFAQGKLKRPWTGANLTEQFKKMQKHMNDMKREAGGHKKRDKAVERRAKNKLKARGKK